MSSTNRGAQRIEHDNYPTPQWCIDALMAEIKPAAFEDRSLTWVEPCRGDKRIYSRMPEGRRYWCEIREGRDYLMLEAEADICITNPPFSIATPFVGKSLHESESVIYLQRLNWLGTKGRKAFWQANPVSHLFVMAERPTFVHVCSNKQCKGAFLPEDQVKVCPDCGSKVKPGTDSIEYGWFCWDRLNILKRPPGLYVI